MLLLPSGPKVICAGATDPRTICPNLYSPNITFPNVICAVGNSEMLLLDFDRETRMHGE